MPLSLVIPVWNDAEGLTRLFLQLRDLRIAAQVIVSDDGSDVPLDPHLIADLSHRLNPTRPLRLPDLLPGADIVWLRSEQSKGAGHARNIAMPHLSERRVLFFDSDDTLLPEMRNILTDLDGCAYDVALFRHNDSRMLATGSTGPIEPDATYWRQTPLTPAPTVLDRAGELRLCRISAYPWNKIWRRDFLQRVDLRCTEIPVHNDIEHHWTAFLTADHIVATTRIGCTHHVAHGRQQLTNRRAPDRLRVFEALEAVAGRFTDVLREDPEKAAFAAPFMDFCTRLVPWIENRLDSEEDRAELRQRELLFWTGLTARGHYPLSLAIQMALLRHPTVARPLLSILERAA